MDRKEISSAGTNAEGNNFTSYSDGSYRYDNADGYHYKNSDGKFHFFQFQIKDKIKAAHSLERGTVKLTRVQMAKLDGQDTLLNKTRENAAKVFTF